MTSTFEGLVPDRIPTGELALAPELAAHIASTHGHYRCHPLVGAARSLAIDMIGDPVSDPEFKSAMTALTGREWFVWALIDGPLQALTGELGMEAGLTMLARPGPALGERLERFLAAALAAADDALDQGVDGVVIGEDVAGARGPFIGPDTIETWLVPVWRQLVTEIKRGQTGRRTRARVIMHSDGDIRPVLPLIQAAGFEGIHSLEPEAGIEPDSLINRGLILCGGLSIQSLTRGQDPIASARRLGKLAAGGGLIVGTTTAIVPAYVQPDLLHQAYRAARGVSDANSDHC